MPKTIVRGGYGVYFDYVPQDLLIANFTNSAGLATNPIGPEAVVSLSNNYDSTAFDGSNVGSAHSGCAGSAISSGGRGYFLYAAQPGHAVCAELEFEYPAGTERAASPCSWATSAAREPSWFGCATRTNPT